MYVIDIQHLNLKKMSTREHKEQAKMFTAAVFPVNE